MTAEINPSLVTEEWRRVPGFSDYEVSSLGRVRSWRPRRRKAPILEPRIMTPSVMRNGYRRVSLFNCNGRTRMSVHCLVLEVFVGPRPQGYECRHFPDNDRANNSLSNLSWGTHAQNCEDKRAHGTDLRRGAQGAELNGQVLSYESLSRVSGVKASTIRSRHKRGFRRDLLAPATRFAPVVAQIRAQRGFLSAAHLGEVFGVHPASIRRLYRKDAEAAAGTP